MPNQGFNNSFEKSFNTGFVTGSNAALEQIKEKIKKEAESTEKANKLTALKSAGLQFSEQAIQSGADPKVVGMFAEALQAQKDPDVAEKIYTAALTNAAQQQKDKADFNQTMTKARFESGMLGVTEVIKAMAERGGTFADGTPITAASLQDFGQQASDRIIASVGQVGGQPTQQNIPGDISSKVIQSAQSSAPSEKQTTGGDLLNAPIKSKASFKAEEKKATDTAVAENTSKGTFRFMQQFDRSIKELKKFDPEFDKVGASGWLSRKQASIAEHLNELPETSALKIQILPMANAMAREIEGGRVTDDDRKIYADSFANGLNNPNVTNMRLMSQSIIGLLDKGGNENGKITNQLKMLAKSDTDIFNGVIVQVLQDYPELAKEIYGEGFEVVE